MEEAQQPKYLCYEFDQLFTRIIDIFVITCYISGINNVITNYNKWMI